MTHELDRAMRNVSDYLNLSTEEDSLMYIDTADFQVGEKYQGFDEDEITLVDIDVSVFALENNHSGFRDDEITLVDIVLDMEDIKFEECL